MTLLVSVGITLCILAVFFGIERLIAPQSGRLEERLLRYGARRQVEEGPQAEGRGPSAASAFSGSVNRAIQGRTFAQDLQADLARADIKLTAGEFLTIQAMTTVIPALLGTLILGHFGALFVLGGMGWFAPRWYIGQQQGKRLKAFNEQLADTITLMANTLRSGMSLLQSMEMISREGAAPTGPEFGRVVREVGLGVSPQDALIHLVRRIHSDDLDLMVTAILVQHEVGGNLSKILDTIAHTIRERVKLKGEIRSITGQQRISGYMLSGLPFAVGSMLTLMAPTYLLALVSPMGPWTVLPVIGVVNIILGTLVMQKIVDIEV